MRFRLHGYPAGIGPLLLLGLSLVVAAGYGGPASAQQKNSAGGTVKVLYAGSLAHVMQHGLGSAFARRTGIRFEGFAGGSTRLANEIKGKIRRGDVFLSAHPQVNARLTGQANGDWVDWYATFMRSPLVIGYNPKSRFADELKSKPWYEVVTEPGFRLGRTDPKLDPKGKLTVQAIQQIAGKQNQPKLRNRIIANTEVFPEEGLVGRLQAGQLDAGFFYKGEAVAVGIPTIPIKPVELGAVYTITVLDRAPNRTGAIDFIKFLLGPTGKHILKENGFDVITPPKISGDGSALPDELRSLLNAG